MSDGCKWMIQYHPGPRPTHDGLDSILHLRPIAMCGAFLAGRLLLTITASVKSAAAINQQFLTVWT